MKLHSILTQIASLLSSPLTERDNSQELVLEGRERERQEEKKRGKEGGRENKHVYFMHLQSTIWELSETRGHFIVCFQNRCRETPIFPQTIRWSKITLEYVKIAIGERCAYLIS